MSIRSELLVVILGATIALAVILIKARLNANAKPRPCIFKVEPVSEKYDWRLTEPVKYRPMKRVYHMVMNIGKVVPEDWLQIDKDYERVVKSHLEILDGKPDLTCKANSSLDTLKAVQELYELVIDVLCQRYPKYFTPEKDIVYNALRDVSLPRNAATSGLSAECLLRLLMENTEDDFQVLQHDPVSDEYVIRAIGGLTSDGFVWQQKLDKKLTDVHGPVPGYKEKLKNSMNKFFNKLQPGSIIQRHTWGIHLGDRDHKFHPNKVYVGSGPEGEILRSDVDFENDAWLRVERQCPTKLPRTGFLILTQHTYWYPLKSLKEEGIGALTADSIEAWPEPFAEYKGREQWCEAVCSYLRE